MKHLGLFAKHWRPGTVKTRLAATLGPVLASQVYRVFLDHLLEELGRVGDRREVVFWPPEARPDFLACAGSRWRLQVQNPGDLGQRMESYFAERFADRSPHADDSPRRVIIVGADCPQLLPEELETAFAALQTHEVVIGPSTDGGYYLLGFQGQCRDLFTGIPWSTARVFAATQRHLQQGGWRYHCLPPHTDVDDEPALVDLWQRLHDPSVPDAWVRLRQALAPLLSFLPDTCGS